MLEGAVRSFASEPEAQFGDAAAGFAICSPAGHSRSAVSPLRPAHSMPTQGWRTGAGTRSTTVREAACHTQSFDTLLQREFPPVEQFALRNRAYRGAAALAGVGGGGWKKPNANVTEIAERGMASVQALCAGPSR